MLLARCVLRTQHDHSGTWHGSEKPHIGIPLFTQKSEDWQCSLKSFLRLAILGPFNRSHANEHAYAQSRSWQNQNQLPSAQSRPTEARAYSQAGLGCRPLTSSLRSIFLAANIAQGSVGGARHEISQIGTGDWATVVALDRRSSEGLSGLARGGSGIRGDLAAWPQTLLAPCIVARGKSHPGIRFATRVNIPLDPPIPMAWPCSRLRKGCWLWGADPLWSAEGPVWVGEVGDLRGGRDTV